MGPDIGPGAHWAQRGPKGTFLGSPGARWGPGWDPGPIIYIFIFGTKSDRCKCQHVQEKDDIMGTWDQYRCNKCHALRARCTRLVNSTGVEGYEELDTEARQDLMKRATNLYGANLQKVLHESITKMRQDRQTTAFVSTGDAIPFAEAEQQYKDSPEWQAILENAPRFFCKIRNIEMIIPAPKSE